MTRHLGRQVLLLSFAVGIERVTYPLLAVIALMSSGLCLSAYGEACRPPLPSPCPAPSQPFHVPTDRIGPVPRPQLQPGRPRKLGKQRSPLRREAVCV